MKKITAIFLSLLMVLSMSSTAFAAITWLDTNVSFDVASDGEHTITVASGEEITVTFTVNNVTNPGEKFPVQTLVSKIHYDDDFFELDESSITRTFGEYNLDVRDDSAHEWYICYNGFHNPTIKFQDAQVIGTFKLKVIATSGSSTLTFAEKVLAYGDYYPATENDLTVFVGEKPPVLYNVQYMHNDQVYKTAQMSGTITIDSKPSPAPANHEFLGWECDGKLYQPGEEFEVTEDVTFTSKWKEIVQIINYDLTFNTNGGTAIEKVTAESGSEIDLASYTTTKTGFIFDGWYSDEALTQKVSSITLDSNKTVYAKWKEVPKPKYTLTFNANGGTAVAEVTADEGTEIDLASYTTTKTGFIFEGWYLDEALTKEVTSVTLSGNKTVYAKWKAIPKKFTLTFNTNGGTALAEVTADEGTEIDLAAYTTTKTGFIFEGWYSDDALTQKVSTLTLADNTTVYAKWKEATKPTFTLTFDTNGGSDIASVTKEKGTEIDLSDYKPKRSGYTFEGWFEDSALTKEISSITLNANTTVYAKWEEKSGGGGGGGGGGMSSSTKYTLTFETNGGLKIDSLEAKKGTKISLSKHVTEKAGFDFDGWYSDKELTKKITEVTLNKDTTIYAKWVASEKEPEVQKPDYKPEILTDEHYAYIIGRDGGMIAPESDITRAEVATIIYRLLDKDVREKATTKENVFTDVNEGDWFNTAVSTLAKLELVNGRTADSFAPNAPLKRAELATIFARMVEVEHNGKQLFGDVSGHWAESYINEAATAEWIIGYNGLFRPEDNITRAEVMTLVNRVLNREPETKADMLDGMTTWKDNADENAWYYLAVQEATNSHTYEMKPDGKHEKWTSLTENPDWSKLEK